MEPGPEGPHETYQKAKIIKKQRSSKSEDHKKAKFNLNFASLKWVKNGAEDEARTRDILLGKETFYH
jgi:hypothetical protein